jgi:hypothetical protein
MRLHGLLQGKLNNLCCCPDPISKYVNLDQIGFVLLSFGYFNQHKQTFRSLTEFEGRRNSVQNYNFPSKECSPVLSRYFSQYKYSISLCVQQANEVMDTNINASIITLNTAVTRSRKRTTIGRWNTEIMSLNSVQSYYENEVLFPLLQNTATEFWVKAILPTNLDILKCLSHSPSFIWRQSSNCPTSILSNQNCVCTSCFCACVMAQRY